MLLRVKFRTLGDEDGPFLHCQQSDSAIDVVSSSDQIASPAIPEVRQRVIYGVTHKIRDNFHTAT